MMNGVRDLVRLNDLNWLDETFAISNFVPLGRLQTSLQSFGMLSTPWIWTKPDGSKVIVDGFKRLAWARRQGMIQVECAVFPAEYDSGKLMVERIEAKLFESTINTAEKAQIISKLAGTCPEQTVLEAYLPRLGVAPQSGKLEEWIRLAHSSRELLAAAALDEISERAALELVGWERQSQTEMVSILSELRCSASIQWEILERVREIAVREETTAMQVLSDAGLVRNLRDPKKNHREKTQLVRAWLYQRRYPRIRAREEAFLRDLADISLPNNVKVLPPPSFEGQNWQLQLHFTSQEELLDVLKKLQNAALSPQFTKLMQS